MQPPPELSQSPISNVIHSPQGQRKKLMHVIHIILFNFIMNLLQLFVIENMKLNAELD